MGSDALPSFSITALRKVSNYDEISMQQSLHFAESLKDLKNLRKQLYSAAEYFESSYDKDDRQQIVMESSKEYVAKALVSTVDHLGSVADRLSKFVDEKANEFSATNIRFSCIEQRLGTFQRFVNLRGISQHSLMIEAPRHHKQYLVPESSQIEKSKLKYQSCIPCSQYDMHQSKKDNPYAKAFQVAQPPLLRKGHSMLPSKESSPNPVNFSFIRVMSKKETVGNSVLVSKTKKSSISPLRFPLKRSGSVANRSVSPIPSDNKYRSPSESRRGTSAHTKPEMTSRERPIEESYTKRSKHFFKGLLNTSRSRKENHTLQMALR